MVLRPHRYPGDIGLSGTNLARAGDYNQRVVLQAIRSHGELTRGKLAKITGLTHQSTINITKRLIAEGMVLDLGRVVGARGQPAMRLTVNPEGAYALGLNLDRDHMTAVIMDFQGRVRDRIYIDKHFAMPNDALAFVKEAMDNGLRRLRIPRSRLVGVGLAIPDHLGGVDVDERPDGYDQWSQIDLTVFFSTALKVPVFIENDATSAALGELQFGQGLRHKNFIYTLISAGIGCGLIINSQPFPGGLTHAGEIGNIPITPENGQARTLWNMVSLYALYGELARRGITVTDPDDLVADGGEMEVGIDAWVTQAAGHMIAPFLAITYALSPELHVIGGQLPAFVAEKLCLALNQYLDAHEGQIPLTRFTTSTASVDAAAMGAAVLVFQNRLLPGPNVLKASI
jgi:predicted NBD/HSP70 family sugar kinase